MSSSSITSWNILILLKTHNRFAVNSPHQKNFHDRYIFFTPHTVPCYSQVAFAHKTQLYLFMPNKIEMVSLWSPNVEEINGWKDRINGSWDKMMEDRGRVYTSDHSDSLDLFVSWSSSFPKCFLKQKLIFRTTPAQTTGHCFWRVSVSTQKCFG